MAKMKVLPHEKLGITFAELGALLGTLSMLENEVIHHVKPRSINKVLTSGKHVFNMNIWLKKYDCGTASCVGGTMNLITGKDPEFGDGNRGHACPLNVLFFPNRGKRIIGDYSHITVPQTIKTIKHFLATGKVDWSHVRKSPR